MSYCTGGTRTFGTLSLCALSPRIQAILQVVYSGVPEKGEAERPAKVKQLRHL